jgi:hypothetical protein
MTKIQSPLGNFNRPSNRQSQQQQPPIQTKKTYFVSDESDENFVIPELDYPEQNQRSQPQPSLPLRSQSAPQQRIDFQSAEEFNQFRNRYTQEAKKKQESVEAELKQNIEILLGLGVRDDKIVVDDFGFQLRTLGDLEKEEVEKELILLRDQTIKDCPGITEKEMESLLLMSRVRRVLAKSIFGVFRVEDEKEIEKRSFDEFIGSSDYLDKLQVTSNFQEPLRNILFALYSKIDNAAPKNFPTIESLANEIKK